MADDDLLHLWTRVEAILRNARQLLSHNVIEQSHGAVRFEECLRHNELELALSELEELGSIDEIPISYWMMLSESASLMNLDEYQNRFAARIREHGGDSASVQAHQQMVFEILSRRHDTGITDLAERNKEHQP